ncbi:MAG: hypothetical protein GY729_16385 [Desulfobacteraceae bacterium]|nr:hypothetical protein [Desulfobacteraceae bacterium]
MKPMISKLVAPVTTDVIPRDRLTPLLNTIAQNKLTTVIAGAGYGKTSLVAQAASDMNLKIVWYRLDSMDNDLPAFINYLISGIRGFFPVFWENYKEDVDSTHLSSRDAVVLANEFLLEMDDIVDQDLFLILDDFHLIRDCPQIHDFLQVLLDRFMPCLHLVLISRSMPTLKLSRLLAARKVTRITEQDLAFTPEEIKVLFEALFYLPLSKKCIKTLHQKTGGWISGLILFHHALRDKSDSSIKKAIQGFSGAHRYIFNYLEENVFQQMPDHIQEFLLNTAILSRLPVTFCDTFLAIDTAKDILCELEDTCAFTFSTDEDRQTFFYHHLFQDYLKAKLKINLNTKEIGALYNNAALLYEKNDEGQEALKHHILAGNIQDASRLLNHLARPIIKQGRPQMVKSLLSIIPKHYMDDEPWFQYLEAGYLGLCNQLQLAVKGYENVLKLFRKHKDVEGECICRMELAEYYLSIGDMKRSESEYRSILNKNKLDAYLTIIVTGYLIRVLALSGKTSDADRYAKKATKLLAELNDEVSLKMGQAWLAVAQGYRFAFSGSYRKAMEMGEHSKELFESVGQYRFLFSSYFLISYSCFYLGLFPEGSAAAMEGLQTAREKGGFDEFSKFLRLWYARNCLELATTTRQEILKILDDGKKNLASFKANAFPEGIAQAYLVLSKAYMRTNNVIRAQDCLKKGMKVLKGHKMPLIKNELKVALSEILFFAREKEHNQEAMALLKDAEQELYYSGWHMCWISRIYARYYWEAGHKETAFKYIVHSLKIGEEESFDDWIIAQKDWIIPLLVELFSMASMADYIKRLFSKMGSDIEPKLLAFKSHKKKVVQKAAAQISICLPKPLPPAIRAYFLGPFKLFMGDRQIHAHTWKSKKAKTLFKYLLCKRNNGYLDKEILMELLWPDEDPKKSAQRFHVALASLRKTLEPDILKGIKSNYIIRSGPAYKIDMGDPGYLDIEAFLSSVEMAKIIDQPEKAIGYYKKAQSIYQGDFLSEDPYDAWCVDEREKYKQAYLSVLKKIMDIYEFQQDYRGCIITANNYLKADKYAESVLRRLMLCHARTGNNPMITQIYEKFKETIWAELNCELSQKTQILYTQLSSSTFNFM